MDDEELRKSQRVLRDRVPFAVVGSNTVIEVDGRKIRGRRYPWGVVEGTLSNFSHVYVPHLYARWEHDTSIYTASSSFCSLM